MSELNLIKITGELFGEYAYLLYRFEFDENSDAVSYTFNMPSGAVISNVKIIDNDKRVSALKVIGIAHAAKLFDESNLIACLRRIDDNKYRLIMRKPENKIGTLCISAYLPIFGRIEIPLARQGIGNSACSRKADIELRIRGSAECLSSTHTIDIQKLNDCLLVKTGMIAADRDFCIEIKNPDIKDSAIAVRKNLKTEMLCCVSLRKNRKSLKKITLVYDGSNLFFGAAKAAKSFILALSKLFDGSIILENAKEHEDLETALSCFDNTTCSFEDIIALASSCGNDEIVILVTGNVSPELANNNKIFTVSFGAYFADGFKLSQKHEHIYENDNIYAAAEKVVKKLTLSTDIAIKADGAICELLETDGKTAYVYIEKTGDRILDSLMITDEYGAYRKSLDDIKLYDSFSPISIAYAETVRKKLEKELKTADYSDVAEIKAMLEKTGVKYGSVNSETVFAISGAASGIISLVEDTGIKPYSVFDGKTFMFSETKKSAKEAQAKKIAAYLLGNIRSDGAITDIGEIRHFERQLQTLLSALSLITAGYTVPDSTKNFIGDFVYNGISYSENTENAKKMLKKAFPSVLRAHQASSVLSAAHTLYFLLKQSDK